MPEIFWQVLSQPSTCEHDCTLTDGTIQRLMAYVIAETVYDHCDNEGKQFRLLKHLVENQRDASTFPISKFFV